MCALFIPHSLPTNESKMLWYKNGVPSLKVMSYQQIVILCKRGPINLKSLQMRAKIIICICLAILPSTIISNKPSQKITRDDVFNEVHRIAQNKESINNVFRPCENGHLGNGSYGFTYKGILLSNNMDVAMKIAIPKDYYDAVHEYEIYSYLDAINNTQIEALGIPSVYYYGQWNHCILLAITLLDSEFTAKTKNPKEFNVFDTLIIFREFVRITKYMHSRGVCHMDATMDNFMFRKQEGFIIDYTMAVKMFRSRRIESPEGISRIGTDCAKEDWDNFLYSMALLVDIELDTYIIEEANILFEKIEHLGLRKVYLEFFKCAIKDGFPSYDNLYKIINEEINNVDGPKPVSWLTDQQKRMAEFKLTENRAPSIKSIKDPSKILTFHYATPKLDYFKHVELNNKIQT